MQTCVIYEKICNKLLYIYIEKEGITEEKQSDFIYVSIYVILNVGRYIEF